MTIPLDHDKLQTLRQQLLHEHAELHNRIHANDHYGLSSSYRDSTGELSAIDNHPADAGTEMFERSKDIALLEKQAFRLERIEAALQRMDTGEYGHCKACGKFIPFDRLEALPTAIYCIEHEPRQQPSNDRPFEEEFLSPPFESDGENAWEIVVSWGNSSNPAIPESDEGPFTDFDEY